ncbi:hypothetical protein FOA43_002266 [Brettanomyces nanus]|uniref:Mitochondrial adapter protein MCP1 transmembrane domain-containing protein n=1 Tax=Eeniella nana TaxID=13502 RepID=A0A875S1V2_EENNA|nr:uncharacterized protein FOA43_002266 [Brettanomyces nanus]QPG74928.1 hypothetical protein FOA43_002266 [Brettanomyces nanus]
MSLQQVPPEPIQPEILEKAPGIPITSPSNTQTPFLSHSISVLAFIQKYSVIPFSLFTFIHLSGVVITPALFGIDPGNEVIDIGREVYQTSLTEPIIIGSVISHASSGILLNLFRRILRYKKYGSSRYIPKEEKSTIKTTKDKEEVKDVNEGLGGLSSFLGLGSKKALTYRLFGISPISFSGYILCVLLSAHVIKLRFNPLQVDGDSSYVDLSYLSYCISKVGAIIPVYTLFVFTGAYHMITGANRFFKLFSKKARKVAYFGIYSLSFLAFVSLIRIARMDPVTGTMAARFHEYLEYI